ncbi:putative esterase [Gordonia araii NBRC 100433]|uniref:Putative esterase n=1 Tax=Gordonia araii NBRC 100433 TaxID=1073574 RepID=G7H3Y8_9ACTN|nr:alpha/beta hydrolase [Gordonia araii]NNG96372.1 alpha/beta hydrolase [Gordonia araii NBRC 100433]GAB10563.1 putative esterase [Gordonia araii NBRC 100433]
MTTIDHSPDLAASAPFTTAERIQRTAFTAIGRVPERILRRLVPDVVNADGDVMAPEIAFLMKVAASAPDFSDGTVAQARAAMDNDCRVFADDAPAMAVDDIALPSGIRASLYRPATRSTGLVVFLHGGGFALGSRAGYDVPVRLMADRAGVTVLSVEYRLAPEAPFPGPVDDALEAWRFAVDRAAEWSADPRRIVLLGDSAGANLCAVLANSLSGESLRPLMQVLMYPAVDALSTHPSRSEFAANPALSAKQIDWLTRLYLPDGNPGTDPRISPLRADDLSGAPATLITVAGFDPLRDEAIAYADRLAEAGVPTRLMREGALVHGYLSLTRISTTARDAVNRVADAIADALR